MADFLDPIRGRPIGLHWAGWESDTHRLQQAGWRLSAYQDVCRDVMQIAMKHDQAGFEALSELSPFHYMEARQNLEYIRARTRMAVNTMHRTVYIQSAAFPTFEAITASPQFFAGEKIERLEDLAHFPPAPLRMTTPFVLPEATVDDLLAQILDKQQEAKTQYFRDMVAKQGQALPAHRFHAQIISLRDAA